MDEFRRSLRLIPTEIDTVMTSGKVPLPSAPPPPEDESSSSGSGHRQPAEAPQPQPPQTVTTSHVSAPHPAPSPGFYAEAPPSYQAALTSPVNPPYPGEHAKMPQPNAAPTGVTPMYHPAPPYQPQQLNPNLIPVSAPVVIHTTSVHPRGDCAFCQTGNIRNETDFCCLLCLIIIAVFTFPFGLLLLCCIPCTVRKRCTRCRRIY
ncbi:hypothetical protein QR680_018783 [Steinernema hermaphroditum]|uniref:Membrane protein BRI3 n=1 Tax=Steinernema hermaphroditum TaxID=289476 RepID=A0AA39HLB4_9BILA|nr:hypothetical protein QR680_018783 [Steinernema hermaphroditum]